MRPQYRSDNYKTGTYLIICRKAWACADCKIILHPGSNVFTRIVCFGETKINARKEEYQHKTFTRFCIDCAMARPDLTAEEKVLLNKEVISKLTGPQQAHARALIGS